MAKTVFLTLTALLVGFCIGLMSNFGCLGPASTTFPSATMANAASPLPSPDTLDTEDNAVLLESAAAAVTALRQRDYAALAALVHPEKGVVFTPYSTVELDSNVSLTPSQVAGAPKDPSLYQWGLADGSGEPISLTIPEYFDRYVYNADYAKAPIIGVDQVIGQGNALENVQDVFPDARFVEYYFPGLNPEYNGFDWCGLKLVFTPYEEAYRLIAIIHSEWTI